jgi:FkbM family methyltransferase
VTASVPHDWLFHRCAVVLHHGGSGTVAAAARAGVPQATLPLMFDQHYWAEKLTWLGVAPPPLSRSRILDADPRAPGGGVAEVATAIASALRAATSSPELSARAAQLGATLRAEDGVAVAVAALVREAAAGDAAKASKAAAELLAAAPAADAPTPLVRMQLPGGVDVLAVSPEETHFLHAEVFVTDVYLRHGFGDALPRGALVLDVGANIGLFCMRLASLFASRGDDAATVWALEPLPACFAALTANTRALRCVRAERVGVVAQAGEDATAPFTFYPRMAGNSTLRPAEKAALQGDLVPARFWQGAVRVDCPVTTLSAFMHARLAPEQRIALLKLDVEGAELDALRGVRAADWPRIDAVVAEVHDTDGRAAAAAALLSAAGFAHVFLDRGVLAAAGAPSSSVMLYARRHAAADA